MEAKIESENHLLISSAPTMLIDSGLHLNSGEVIYEKVPADLEYRFSEDPSDMLQDNLYGNGVSGLLVSKKIRSLFDSLEVHNIQYFPVKLINEAGGMEMEGYSFANIVGIYSVVDMTKSDVEESDVREGLLTEINSLVLKDFDENDYPAVFRIKEKPRLVLVKDDLKRAIENSDITGLEFQKPEEYSS